MSPWWGISLAAHVALFTLLALSPWRPPDSDEDGDRGGMLEARILAPEDEIQGEDPQDRILDVNPELLGEETREVPVPGADDDEAPVVEGDEPSGSEPATQSEEIPLGAEDGFLEARRQAADVALDLARPGDLGAGILGIGGGAIGTGSSPRGLRSRHPGGGRGKNTDDAVEHALRWLAAHRSPDGRWESAGWDRWCEGGPSQGRLPGAGSPTHDVGVTGLALLAFLGAGYTNRGDHPFAKVVSNGLRWLKGVQDADGCFGPRTSPNWVYDHAVASLAMVEAYGHTGSTLFKGPAQKALDFIAAARNPSRVWRYGVRPGDDDTSVTGWMMMALESARRIDEADARAGKPPSLAYDAGAAADLATWFDEVTDPATGRVGYRTRGLGPVRPIHRIGDFPPRKSEALTAVGILGRVFLGQDPKSSPQILTGADLCVARLPVWDPADGSIDMTYWYYGTLAMFQVGGPRWTKWNEAMRTAIVDRQRSEGEYGGLKGSWDPLDPWGAEGGRVYSTAILTLCLEVYYRYDKVFGTGER